MELRQVRYFMCVVKHRSFTKAAAELFVVQPALSRQIKRLEEELGVELIDRRNGQVTPTLAGATFLRRAATIVSDVNIALAEMRGFSDAATGRVAVGAMYTLNGGAVNFPELFSGFSARYPGIQLRFREGTTDDLIGHLRNGELDLALIDISLVADSADLSTELITDEELVVLVGPEHPLAAAGWCRLEDLAHERFIRLGPGSTARRLKLVRLADEVGFAPQFAFHAGSVDIARALVSRGLGINVTHPWAGEGPGPPIVKVRLHHAPLRCRVVLAQMLDTYRSPAVSAFLEYAWPMLHFRGLAAP